MCPQNMDPIDPILPGLSVLGHLAIVLGHCGGTSDVERSARAGRPLILSLRREIETHPCIWRLPVLVMTCFLIRDYSVLPRIVQAYGLRLRVWKRSI